MAAVIEKIASEEVGQLKYCEIPANLYRKNSVVDQDLYLYYQGQYIIFRSRNHKWLQEDTEKLAGFGVSNLYIKCGSEVELHNFLDNKLPPIFEDPKVPISEKAKILYSASLSALQSLYDKPESPDSVNRAARFVKHCIGYLSKDRAAFIELFKLTATDFTEQAHAFQVAMYSIALGKQLGYRAVNDSLTLGLGALFHDIGKTRIEKSILEKPDDLTETELHEVQLHPEYGYQILASHNSIPQLSKLIVLQHHEKSKGRGYPHKTEDVHIFCKIVAISDCFDSLVSERPYRKALKSLDALKFMLTHFRNDFEQTLLINFIKMLQE